MFYTLMIAIFVCADILTKRLAVIYLKGSESYTAIKNVLDFTYIENTGAAFSILSGKQALFIILTIAAVFAMMYILFFGKNRNRFLLWGLTLACAGGIGNLVDRIKQGYVIDFFELKFINFAVFNVADIFISAGTVLLFIYLLFYSSKEKTNGN